MKPLFLFFLTLLCASSGSVLAQKQQNVVQESETDDNYFFRVIFEHGHSKQLMRCTNLLTDSNINVKMKGSLTLNVDEQSELNVNTRKRLFTIEHNGSDPDERERVKALVDEARDCLGVPAPPPPPRL